MKKSIKEQVYWEPVDAMSKKWNETEHYIWHWYGPKPEYFEPENAFSELENICTLAQTNEV